jgi:hypothetical protein
METQIIKVLHIGPSREKGWVYSQDGVMATMTSTCYKEPPKVLVDTDYNISLRGENIYDEPTRD